MAVKSAEISDSASLQKEREVLAELQQCPYVVRCYGEEFTDEKNGDMVYNLLLEYASGGTLAKLIKNSKQGELSEFEIKHYTRSILRGLQYIHENGYVHLDINPNNILLVPCLKKNNKRKRNKGSGFDVKIADFGLAKRFQTCCKERWRENSCLVGTPEYMSPESITHYKQEPPADIWALGCVVAEMVTGKPALSRKVGEDVDTYLYKVASGLESPKIPSGMSKEGQDFLKRCFVRNSEFRWTAEMLLLHPFVALGKDDVEEGEELVSHLEEESVVVTCFVCLKNRKEFEEEEEVFDRSLKILW
ncbi:Mitogen-activated protein kinase kinase kinase [Thalictrum thalictroides]|uniref:Mitogen-activated protein kinase kinase kinase n=1 Tax=Thalictrum thalictroides TaxID=46969 RepID=A0A7J6VX34_THATH|nr:Mitogen-activated protein kinase kinase kinase [Thalictrum thalictroides]